MLLLTGAKLNAAREMDPPISEPPGLQAPGRPGGARAHDRGPCVHTHTLMPMLTRDRAAKTQH